MPDSTAHRSPTAPAISVVVAPCAAGAPLHRLVESLDVQTMPRDEVEVLLVDDGSSDERTGELHRLAGARRTARVLRAANPASSKGIANPRSVARLRNTGLDGAGGDYVIVLDADDVLLPDTLTRAHEYAVRHRADVLSLRGVSVDDPWQMLARPATESVPNALHERGIARLRPYHAPTLLRRDFLREHDIRFPEDHLAPWQDTVVSVLAYRHARVVSVLADRPAFRRHGDGDSIDRNTDGYWDRLDELFEFLVTALDAPDCEDARLDMLAELLRARALDPLSDPSPQEDRRRRADLERARTLVRRYGTDEVLANLPRRQRIQAALLQGSGMELGELARRVDLPMAATTTGRAAQWQDGVLRVDLECAWRPAVPEEPPLRRADDRVRWALDGEIAAAVPGHLLDVTEDADELTVRACARARHRPDTWELPVTLGEIGYQEDENGAVFLIARGELILDPACLAGGAPVASDVWDIAVRASWLGFRSEARLDYQGGTCPAVVAGRALVAYRSNDGTLAVDTAGRERTLAVDARPRSGVPSPQGALKVPLDNVTIVGDSTLDAGQLAAVPEGDPPAAGGPAPTGKQLEHYATTGSLHLEIVPGAGGGWLEGTATLWPGRYRIYARRGGKLRRTACAITVELDGTLTFV